MRTERSVNYNKLGKRLRREVGKAVADFDMIRDNDHIMCCLSGGKDSYTMLDILLNLQKYAPVRFKITAVNLDQRQPGFPEEVLPNYLSARDIPHRIVQEDTYSIVKSKTPAGKTTCALCSRLRRGILYRTATELGATKIALGHHREDILETLFLNMFYGGRLKAMPPKLRTDDGRHIVIRPLAYCAEKDITRYAKMHNFPIIPCNLCGGNTELQRKVIKDMLHEWDSIFPGRIESMFRAIRHITPSHMADTQLFDFKNLDINAIPLQLQNAIKPLNKKMTLMKERVID